MAAATGRLLCRVCARLNRNLMSRPVKSSQSFYSGIPFSSNLGRFSSLNVITKEKTQFNFPKRYISVNENGRKEGSASLIEGHLLF